MKKIYVLVTTLLSINAVYAQTETLDSIFRYYQIKYNFNGVVAMAQEGKLKYLDGNGIANRSDSSLIKSKSLFKIASVTKTFTATLIMQLIEEKKMKLEDTISKYLPSYPGDAKNKVTIYQLLTYSSGIPNCEHDSGIAVYQKRLSVDDFILKNCSGNVQFKPGSQFEYNNADYIILGKIIENVTGNSFIQNLKQRILQPLQMNDTGMLSDSDVVYGLVSSYTFEANNNKFYQDQPYYVSNFSAAGAMYSTAEDLIKFDNGLFNHKILNQSSVQQMIQPDTALQNVGLGFWFTNGYGDLNTDFVYRPGGILGSTINWVHLLKEDIAIIILSNTDATSLFQLTSDLYKVSKSQGIF